MDVAESISDEQIDISGREEDVADEPSHQLETVAPSTIQKERHDLGEHHHAHSCDCEVADSRRRDHIIIRERLEEIEDSQAHEEEHQHSEYDGDGLDLTLDEVGVGCEREQHHPQQHHQVATLEASHEGGIFVAL